MINDPTPAYLSRLQSEGWAKVAVGADSVRSSVADVRQVRATTPAEMRRRALAGVDWDGTGGYGVLAPQFWARRGDMLVIVPPFEADQSSRSSVSQGQAQAVSEAALDVLAGKLAKVRAERGGGSLTVIFAGGGHLKLPESFRRAMSALGITVEILDLDGTTSIVPPPD